MKKLLILSLLLALAVTASPALARGGADRIAGEITALDGATGVITLQPRYGDPATVQTSADTEFYRKVPRGGLEPITFEDLVVGDRIVVEGAWDGDLFNADEVVVVASATPPPPPPPASDRFGGVITALDAANGTITLQARDGDVTVQTSTETEFYRMQHHGDLQPITFDDLAVGDKVRVEGAWNGDLFDADRVIAMPVAPPPPPEDMVGGVITALDAAAGTITIQSPHSADPITIQTSDETEFYRMIHQGGLEPITFDDLAVGDQIGAEGAWDGDLFNAEKVMVKSWSPPSGDMVEGTITSLDAATGVITIRSMDGSTVTVQTSAETEFYRMVGHDTLEPITFDDLAVGDRIVANGVWDGDLFNASRVVVEPEMTQKSRLRPIRARIQPTGTLSQRY
ncbi:MAG TPA: hypothetical protein ENJ31_08605 [Anaerolineae bacterium]|nr:hypothetical protein [Anaerolineae bacterium]